MKYARSFSYTKNGDDKMELRPCDLILVKGTEWISKEIEDITESQYSHVAGVIMNTEQIVEAEGFQKTGQVPLTKYDEKDYDVYRYENLTEEQRDMIMKYINKEIGGHYNYFMLVIEFIKYIFKVIVRYKEPVKSHICSMLWYDAYKSAGIDLCEGAKYPSPKDIGESKLLKKIN